VKRRTFLQGTLGCAWAAANAKALSAMKQAASQGIPAPSANDPEYIVVGSGPGGGPLAANLARRGHSVLLIEAGLDNMYQSLDYEVPLLTAASAPEDPRLEWEFFVRHYANLAQQLKDDKMQFASDGTPLGIFYPRAATVGGCASHDFLIAVKPHASDWDGIAKLTGDESWASSNMTKYWERLERNSYGPFVVPGPDHGYNGWLGTQIFDPNFILTHDPLIVRNLLAAALQFPSDWSTESLMATLNSNFEAFLSTDPSKPGLLTRDLNSGDPGRDFRQGLFSVPFSIYNNRRSSPREFIAETVALGYPLTLKTGALATRVLFEPLTASESQKDKDKLKAVGLQYLDGTHLYQADPNAVPPDSSTVLKTVRAKREIILAGGSFNTPQLLMLSGIGPASDLRQLGINPLIDLPGVGRNLQDRYEVGIIAVTDKDYSIFNPCTFATTSNDPCLAAWSQGQEGIYNSAGTMGVVVMRSSTAGLDPDLFLYAAPYNFTGYYRGYTEAKNLAPDSRHFTWGILKAHTRNRAGRVTLQSTNPLERPQIVFHYFDEGTTRNGAAEKDLEAIADGVEFVRRVIAQTNELMSPVTFTEILPGPAVQTREQIKEFIRNEAWSHHASGTAKIGADDDPAAVLDSRFRVRGAQGLRVVDASIFPRIPGYFIVVPIAMASEKAADVILEDLNQTTAKSDSGQWTVESGAMP
jgi:choline dehydrogenase